MHGRYSLNSEKIAYALIILFIIIMGFAGLNYITGKNEEKPVEAKIDNNGNTVLKSADGLVTINVPQATKTNADHISVQLLDRYPFDASNRVSEVYKFGPSETAFSSPVDLEFKYDTNKVKECPNQLTFFHYNDYGTPKETIPSKYIDCEKNIVVFEVSSFSDGYAGDGNGCKKNRLFCHPQISSIEPATAEKCVTQLKIRGTELTDVAQFFDSSNNRYTEVGKVNEGRTETTIVIQGEVPKGHTRVRIYAAADKVSNEKKITVTGDQQCGGEGEGDGLPEIISINPQSLPVGATLAINGRRLTNVVQFFDSQGGRYTLTGNVNGAHTITTVVIASELIPGSYTVKVRKAADKISNGVDVTITSGDKCENENNSQNGGMVVVKPTKTWSPKSGFGWYPRISPDGKFVAYGFGNQDITNLQTGQEKSLGSGNYFGAGWIKDDTYSMVYAPDAVASFRYEVKTSDLVPKKTNDDPKLVVGLGGVVAAEGHWARSKSNSLVYDNKIVYIASGSDKVVSTPSVSQEWLVFGKGTDTSWKVEVYKNGQPFNEYTSSTTWFGTYIRNGYVAYGGKDKIIGITPDGQEIDLMVSANEGMAKMDNPVLFVNGKPWVATWIWDDTINKGYALLRPWGEKNGIKVEIIGNLFSVVYVNGTFILGANGPQGQLEVLWVPYSGTGSNPSPTTPTNVVDATPGWLGDLAFDSKNNNWLVVSHNAKTIQGRIIKNDGTYLTNSFQISPSSSTETWSPMAAYSADADKFLVIWQDISSPSYSEAHMRFVSTDGTIGNEFKLSIKNPWFNVGGDRTSALKYDSKNQKFVLIWENRGAHHSAMFTTIDLSGKVGTFVELIDDQNGGAWGPSIAVNENKNEYCAVYDLRNSGKWVARKIDASTMLAGPASTATVATSNVDITYNSNEKKYLVIYDAGYNIGVKARFLNSCDANDVSKEFLALTKEGYSSVASNPTSNTYAAIGQDGSDGGNGYSVFDSTGTILSSGNPFTGARNGQFLPVIRANTNDGTFAATSSKDYAVTRFVAGLGLKSCGSSQIGNNCSQTAWTPKQTNNGWFPQLSPDGRYVTYGFGENWAADLQTGKEYPFGPGFNGWWIKNDTYTYIKEINPTGTQSDRYEVKVGQWNAVKTNDNPSLVAGNNFMAADGHWASWLAVNGRIALDNQQFTTNTGGALWISEDWLIHVMNNGQDIWVWKNGQKIATYTAKIPIHGMTINKGYIVYGNAGPIHGIDPNGQDIDLTVTPWKAEGNGQVFFVDSSPWVASATEEPNSQIPLILLRPWGSNKFIAIKGAASGLSIVYANSKFIIAHNGDRGQLRVVTISANSPRIDAAQLANLQDTDLIGGNDNSGTNCSGS